MGAAASEETLDAALEDDDCPLGLEPNENQLQPASKAHKAPRNKEEGTERFIRKGGSSYCLPSMASICVWNVASGIAPDISLVSFVLLFTMAFPGVPLMPDAIPAFSSS